MKKGLDNASNLTSLVTLPKKRISRLKTSQGINVWRVYTRETHSKDYLFLRKTRHESHSSTIGTLTELLMPCDSLEILMIG